ncbi:MAG TPA: hypothetical protein VHC86_14835 [Opitutaceae bacterium]|nr:hypothetical protein [Opitutaceae bacterium]
MTTALPRSLLRWFHLAASIPVLGYAYSPFADLPKYAPAVRFVFVPVILLSGFWMFAGLAFAALGVALWVGAYLLGGPGPAVLSQIALFAARAVWRVARARRPGRPG